MRKIVATFINESRLFAKDLAGMALLFLMPLVLTTLMAVIQDAPFREYSDFRFDILWVDEDGGKLTRELSDGLEAVPQFRLIREIDGAPLDTSLAKALVQKGQYKIAVLVPKGVSAEVANSANQVANEIGSKIGAPGKLPERESRPIEMRIIFDPVTKQAMKMSILNALEKQLTGVQAEIILSRLESRLEGEEGSDAEADTAGSAGRAGAADSLKEPSLKLQEKLNAVGIREEWVSEKAVTVQAATNSVQHNVPAWAIFGLFFITIPIAGNMIREREDGSLIRIKMIPGSYYPILLGKLGFYVLLGLLQFTVMIAVGYWLMPVLGLDSLHIGNAYGQIALAVLVIACTATAWGVMIGTLFQTPNQALPFGAISIVILSAIGGIWVPVEILPAALQGLARISPLFWSLDLINDLFLRGASFASIAPKILVLLAFTSAFILVSGWVEARRRK